jgi:hypothetical protein
VIAVMAAAARRSWRKRLDGIVAGGGEARIVEGWMVLWLWLLCSEQNYDFVVVGGEDVNARRCYFGLRRLCCGGEDFCFHNSEQIRTRKKNPKANLYMLNINIQRFKCNNKW